ncbi:LPXTG cell wall anchor domain-containing protein, partial [Enterococcus faecalis]|nr:LPXTG cell wall anchor domain-containing protein [Enterococcus faecalis]
KSDQKKLDNNHIKKLPNTGGDFNLNLVIVGTFIILILVVGIFYKKSKSA